MKVRYARWDDPKLRRMGKGWAADAYDFAGQLHSYGADAERYLLEPSQQQEAWAEHGDVCIPVKFADALMALLLALPRKEEKGRRRQWSIQEAQARLDAGETKRDIARRFADRTGQPFESIRRQLHALKRTPGRN